jgi:hypothetical protein
MFFEGSWYVKQTMVALLQQLIIIEINVILNALSHSMGQSSLEKLIIAELVKKYFAFYGTFRFVIFFFHKNASRLYFVLIDE